MRGWSLSLGTYFGIQLRLHFFFVLLVPLLMLYASAEGGSPLRGLMLWLLLLGAVLVREIARVLALAYFGIPSARLVLLPTGAVPPPELDDASGSVPTYTPFAERVMALAGPVANFVTGLTVALLIFSATAQIRLFDRPWVTPSHLMRSVVWTQILLGGLNLLPAGPLDSGVLVRRNFRMIRGVAAGARAAAGLSQSIAWVLIVVGAALQNTWLLVMGASVLLATRSDAQFAVARTAADTVTMRDVMLTEYATLAASDTLEEALRRSVHSLQDVFPVVRGPVIVGAVGRQVLADALRTEGNSYVQSVMTRTVEVVAPGDPLVGTLQRISQRGGAQLLPVVDHDQVVGIVTPHNLSQSMALLGQTRRLMDHNQAKAGAERD